MTTLSPAEWHRRFLIQAGWTETLRRHLFQRAHVETFPRILEVGCGTGAILASIESREMVEPRQTLVGVDIRASLLAAAAQQTARALLARAEGGRLPFADNTFNLAFCHFFLLWVEQPVKYIEEMKRVVKPGGHVMALAEPDYGGRIDYPDELKQLGVWQQDALRRQGADPLIGRRLSACFHQAGLVQVETGLLSGRWSGNHPLGEWESEWEIIAADLAGDVDSFTLERLRATDHRAWESGERVLFVPTFYAWGQKPE